MSPCYRTATPDTLQRRFLNTGGIIENRESEIVVHLNRRTYSPILRQANLPKTITVPWWQGRTSATTTTATHWGLIRLVKIGVSGLGTVDQWNLDAVGRTHPGSAGRPAIVMADGVGRGDLSLGERVVGLDVPRIPTAMRTRAELIIAVTNQVCLDHLDTEYADLCRRLVGKLARKRPSPLARGDHRIWAAGVVYAIGQVNFLFDRAQTPHATAEELSELLHVKKTTMANKAGIIRKAVDMTPFDPDFCRREIVESNPLNWLLQVNGIILDARSLPTHIQRQAAAMGLLLDVSGTGPDEPDDG